MRTLVAGFGNVLRGDDGFGVVVVQRLQAEGLRAPGVELMEVGIGGLRMAQELLSGYDRLIIVDAMTREGSPGSLYVLRVEAVERAAHIDMHLTVPSKALSVAQALGVLPPEVYLVGCEPQEVEELCTELSAPARAAVEGAIESIRGLIAGSAPKPEPSRP